MNTGKVVKEDQVYLQILQGIDTIGTSLGAVVSEEKRSTIFSQYLVNFYTDVFRSDILEMYKERGKGCDPFVFGKYIGIFIICTAPIPGLEIFGLPEDIGFTEKAIALRERIEIEYRSQLSVLERIISFFKE